MGDAGIVMASFAWLVAITGLLQGYDSSLGNGLGSIQHPKEPTQTTQTTGTQGGVLTFLEYSACFIATGVFGLIPQANGHIVCQNAVTRAAQVFQTLDAFLSTIVQFFIILFQLNTMSIPYIPNLVAALLVWPPEMVLGYIGIKNLRGAGG